MSDRPRDPTRWRIGRLRLGGGGAAAGPARAGGGRAPGLPPVVIRGSYRYHKGRLAVRDASRKLGAHLRYIAGESRDKSEGREMFDARGNRIDASRAEQIHAGAYLEHRIVLSPSGRASERELHALAQELIRDVQGRNPGAEVRASYAVHKDTDHPHAHVVISSPGRVQISREDYQELRQAARERYAEMQHERGAEREDMREDEMDRGRF